MAIDWSKPVQTSDGREVVLYTRRGKDECGPVVGEYLDDMGCWTLEKWRSDGTRFGPDHPNDIDLINTPQTRTVWVNFYLCLANAMTRVVRYDI